MANALLVAVQSLQSDLQRMEVISQNMVNLSTTGYRRAVPISPTFEYAVRAAASQAPAIPLDPGLARPVTAMDLSAGPIRRTGQAWDFAILGEGYFELATPDGMAYTRAGDFHQDRTGRLVSQDGYAVQGSAGDITLNGATASVDHMGRILQEGNVVGQIRVVRFEDPVVLQKLPGGLLRPGADAVAVTADGATEIQGGHLEGANVSAMREMVAMMETLRHFESTQKLFQGYDEMQGTAIRKLGEF